MKHLKGLTLVSASLDQWMHFHLNRWMQKKRTSEYMPFQVLVSSERLPAVRAEHHCCCCQLTFDKLSTVDGETQVGEL